MGDALILERLFLTLLYSIFQVLLYIFKKSILEQRWGHNLTWTNSRHSSSFRVCFIFTRTFAGMLEGEISAIFGVVGTYCTCNNCDTVGLAFGSCWRHFRITSIRIGGARSQSWSLLFIVVGNEMFGFGLVIAFTFAHWERMWWKGVCPYTKLYKIHPKDHTSDLKLICWKGKTWNFWFIFNLFEL